MYLVGFDTDLDGVVDDTLNGDENLHRPEISKRSTFVCLVGSIKDDGDSSKDGMISGLTFFG